MTILRPITELSPVSESISEATGLPFGFVLQPFANFSNGKNDTTTTNHTSDHDLGHGHHKSSKLPPSSSTTATTPIVLNEYLIAKCTQCGSPLNPTSDFISTWNALCHLCGYIFSLDYETQQDIRSIDRRREDSSIIGTSREQRYNSRYTRAARNDELRYETIEYSLPLFSISSSSSSSSHHNDIYSLPAALCPPLLTILIDGTSTNPTYYNTIASSIQSLLNLKKDAQQNHNFKGCKIAIFVMTKNGRLSFFDLKTQLGHIKHLVVSSPPLQLNTEYNNRDKKRFSSPYDNDNSKYYTNMIAPLSEVALDVDSVYASLDSDYSTSCIESALRVIADSIVLNQACHLHDNVNTSSKNKGEHNNDDGGDVYLGSTIQYILDFLKEVAYHPGMYHISKDILKGYDNDDSNDITPMNDIRDRFLYAGGKIMCFLAGPPHEIGSTFVPHVSGRVGTGGFGGSCAEVGKRFENRNHIKNIRQHYKNNNQQQNDIEVGNDAGTGSSIFYNETNGNQSKIDDENIPLTRYLNVDTYYQSLGTECAHAALSVEVFGLINESENHTGPYLGFPYLRLLSDRSGGNGPLVIPLEGGGEQQSNNDDEINQVSDNDILLREFLCRSGIIRPTAFASMLRIRLPASIGVKLDREDDNNVDKYPKLKNSRKLFEYYCTNGVYGPVTATNDKLLFLMGSCDTSTQVSFEIQIQSDVIGDYVYADDRDIKLCPCIQSCFTYTSTVYANGSWSTVRRLRVSTKKLNVSSNVESITLSLDNEALAVNRFHKFYHQSILYGKGSIKHIASSWLLNVLLACYKSAKDTSMKTDRRSQHHTKPFNAYDRLLSSSNISQFTNNEILLAKGHEQLQLAPLLIFCLMQCDALRPRQGRFNPSLDSQCAAAANMCSMSPSALSRCIAPRLELWRGDDYDSRLPLHDSLNMKLDDIVFAVKEIKAETGFKLFLFLDSPMQIVIYNCNNLCELEVGDDDEMMKIPAALEVAVQRSVKSYRIAPKCRLMSGENGYIRLKDALVEDSFVSRCTSYDEWLNIIVDDLKGREL